MSIGAKPFDSFLNVLCDVDMKILLVALARCKGVYGYSTIVRSILMNAIPKMVEQLTEPERDAYNRVVQIEREKYNSIIRGAEQRHTGNQ